MNEAVRYFSQTNGYCMEVSTGPINITAFIPLLFPSIGRAIAKREGDGPNNLAEGVEILSPTGVFTLQC